MPRFCCLYCLFYGFGNGGGKESICWGKNLLAQAWKVLPNGMLTTRIGSELDVQPAGLNVDAERSANTCGYRGHKSARDGDT